MCRVNVPQSFMDAKYVSTEQKWSDFSARAGSQLNWALANQSDMVRLLVSVHTERQVGQQIHCESSLGCESSSGGWRLVQQKLYCCRSGRNLNF